MKSYFLLIILLSTFGVKGNFLTDSAKTQLTSPFYPSLDDQFKLKAGDDANLSKYLKAMHLIEEIQVAEDMPEVYPTSAGVYSGGRLNLAGLSSLDQSLQLSRELNDKKYEAETLNAYGGYLAYYGEFNKSILMYKQCITLSETTHNKNLQLKASVNLARLLIFNHHFDEALLLENKILTLCNTLRNPLETGIAYLNIGTLKSMQGKNEEAEKILIKKALPILYRWDKKGASTCFSTLASIYENQKRYSEAKWFYIQANTLSRKIQHPKGIINSLVSLARVKSKIGDNDLALKDYAEAETLAGRINYLIALIEIKSELKNTYQRMGNLTAAGNTLKEYQKIKNTIMQSGS